jgi:hypothetical protein
MPVSDEPRPAHFVRAVQTRWGCYSAGLDVDVLEVDEDRVLVCLDNRHHPGGRCHKVRVLPDAIRYDEVRDEQVALSVQERLAVLKEVSSR